MIDILHHSQEQARCLFHKVNFLVGWASSPPLKSLLRIEAFNPVHLLKTIVAKSILL